MNRSGHKKRQSHLWPTLVFAQSSNPSSSMMLSTFFSLSAVEYCFLGNRRFPENERFSRTVRVPIRTSSYRRGETDRQADKQRKCMKLNRLNTCKRFPNRRQIKFYLPGINIYMCHTTEQITPLSSWEDILTTVKLCVLTCTT